MPWETDGRRWHTCDRVSHGGKACRWEGQILSWVEERIHDLAEFSGEEVVKAWSMVDFLIAEHREKLMAFLGKIRGQKDDEDEKALQEVFGWTLEDFDLRWKSYARASY